MAVHQQHPDGSWTEAQPIGWREEHSLMQRFCLWLLRRPHCSDDERRGR